jgi:hypothetical protein
MKFQREFNYCLIAAVVVLMVYVILSIVGNARLFLSLCVFITILGSSMVVLGFWGSDFAFALSSKHLSQERTIGKIAGEKNKVYVPFMKNYTPLEWWNLNWFITLMGVFFVALGCLGLGAFVGSCTL